MHGHLNINSHYVIFINLHFQFREHKIDWVFISVTEISFRSTYKHIRLNLILILILFYFRI
jgi:hypothetical protein